MVRRGFVLGFLVAAACSQDTALVVDGSTIPGSDMPTGAPVLDLGTIPPDADAGSPPPPPPDLTSVSDPTLVEERPYNTKIPDSYDPSTPTPLLILLHGFSADSQLQDFYLGLGQQAMNRGWLFAYPDGTPNDAGLRYWDATNACCNFADPPQDDVAYLMAVIDDMKMKYNVDAKRVYFFGHSNGGFMSHRMACDATDRIAAIASLAGATWLDPNLCEPSTEVGVLEVHGTLDAVVLYNGGFFFSSSNAYPSAPDTVAHWAALNGCGNVEATNETIDGEVLIPFKETKVSRAKNCAGNGAAELWTIQGASHVPILGNEFYGKLFAFYEGHAKP